MKPGPGTYKSIGNFEEGYELNLYGAKSFSKKKKPFNSTAPKITDQLQLMKSLRNNIPGPGAYPMNPIPDSPMAG